MTSWLERWTPDRGVRVRGLAEDIELCSGKTLYSHGASLHPGVYSCFEKGCPKNHKAPAKRSQHANATYRDIVGRNMLRAFGHRVATCWVLLAQV